MRSDDAGDNWREVSGNLPTDFGFVIDVHAHEPETIYVVPIKSDAEHFPLEGKLRVYRSRSGGNEWEALSNGLPQSDCYVNVLRDAMAVDKLDDCGIYFGTTGGQVYVSSDAGDTWNHHRARSSRPCFRLRCRRCHDPRRPAVAFADACRHRWRGDGSRSRAPVTQRSVLDALEARYPVLRGTIRDYTHAASPTVLAIFCVPDATFHCSRPIPRYPTQ